MISVSKDGKDIGTVKLTVAVKDAEQSVLSRLAVDFTGYGGFKILVSRPGQTSPAIITGRCDERRQQAVEEALALASALEDDRPQITEEIEGFLTEFLGADPKKLVQSVASA